MQLRPVTAIDSPTYPRRSKRSRGPGGWVRRISVAMAASVGISVVGCSPVQIMGAMVEPTFFECSESMPEERPVMTGPGTFDGELCGDDTAWASIEVEQSYTARLELSGADAAVAHVIDPSGYEVAELTAAEPSLEIELTAGTWMLAVDSEGESYGYFQITLSQI